MNLKSIIAEAKIENIALVTDFVNSILEKKLQEIQLLSIMKQKKKTKIKKKKDMLNIIVHL